MTTDPTAAGTTVLPDLYGKRFPVYFLADGTPAAVPDCGPCVAPVFVTSVPKAGTYLTAEVLRRLGVRATDLHVDEASVSDYRSHDPRKGLFDCQAPIPVETTLRLVASGQFAVGHLPANERCRAALAGFRLIVVCREFRQAVVSLVRFLATDGPDAELAQRLNQLPDGPERILLVLDAAINRDWYLPLCRAMAGWLAVPGHFLVRFETLAGDDGPAAQEGLVNRLAEFLGLTITQDESRAASRGSINRPTLTYSGRRSSLDTHWNQAVESKFRAVGGPDVNHAFGYPEWVGGSQTQEAA